MEYSTQANVKQLVNNGKKYILIIAGIVLVLIFSFGSTYKVSEGHSVVVTRFGKVIRVDKESGLKMFKKIPLIDSVVSVNTEQRYKIEYGYRTVKEGNEKTAPQYSEAQDEALMIVGASTSDGGLQESSEGQAADEKTSSSLVLLNLVVGYKVSDPVNFLYKVDDLEGTLLLAIEDTLRNIMPNMTLAEALTDKKSINDAVLPELQRKMSLYEAGIAITEVETQNVELLPKVEEAYREVEKANQYKNGKIEEAKKYYNTVIPEAEAEAAKLIEEANGYKATVIANAKATVAQYNKLYQEYLKNPEIIKEKYYVESMKELLKNNKIIIDATQDGSIYKFFNMQGDMSDMVKKEVIGEGR